MNSVRLRTLVVVAMVAVVAAIAAASIATSEARPSAARLTLDGVHFRPELARTPAARSRGLMKRKRAPADGMLFVFPHPTTTGFWMKNTLVPLTIVFFDAGGRRVARLSMIPCRETPCRIYAPKRAYRFALELRASDRRPARRLGPAGELRRLIRAAS